MPLQRYRTKTKNGTKTRKETRKGKGKGTRKGKRPVKNMYGGVGSSEEGPVLIHDAEGVMGTTPKEEDDEPLPPDPQQEAEYRDPRQQEALKTAKTFANFKEACNKLLGTSYYKFDKSNNNPLKNRYKDILADDRTRVQLSGADDYINANYINLDLGIEQVNKGNFQYIATQGPKENTTTDFHKMIFENDVNCIVMVTRLIEYKKDKCYAYLPGMVDGNCEYKEEEEATYGDYTVKIKSRTTEDNTGICTTEFTITKGGNTKTVTHLWFKKWPDHGVPTINDFQLLLKQFNALRKQNPKAFKSVVHCSAGVGRTGTFIVLDHLLYDPSTGEQRSNLQALQGDVLKEEYSKINETICKLRSQRNNLMVQTLAQYTFIINYIKSKQPASNNALQYTKFNTNKTQQKKNSFLSRTRKRIRKVPEKIKGAFKTLKTTLKNRFSLPRKKNQETQPLLYIQHTTTQEPPTRRQHINNKNTEANISKDAPIVLFNSDFEGDLKPGSVAFDILELFDYNHNTYDCKYKIQYQSSRYPYTMKFMDKLKNPNEPTADVNKKYSITYKMLEDTIQVLYKDKDITQINIQLGGFHFLMVEIIRKNGTFEKKQLGEVIKELLAM